MKQKHIILRSVGPLSGSTEGFLGGMPGARTADVAPGALAVEVDEIDRRNVGAVARHRDVVAIAPAMPMKLVKPVEVSPSPKPKAATVAWGVEAVHADTSPFTGDGVVVAVLDTGIAKNHDAFKGLTIVEKDFTGEGNGDQHGHGTHCAGTILGRDTANTRIGVARGVKKALIGKVLGNQGGGSDGIVSAMNWAVENGANVISMSLGIDFPGFVKELTTTNGLPTELATSLALEGYRLNVQLFASVAASIRALAQFHQPCLIVVAAGNESQRDVNPDFEIAVAPPAVAEGNISVAALGQSAGGLTVATFSNTGAIVSGPGVKIVSADRKSNTGLVQMSGTSMATPHVAGVAALWGEKLKADGQFNLSAWNSRLIASSVTSVLQSPFDPTDVGSGLVQAPQ
ncbi:MAG: S8 family serine peptidase [Bryobacteraceae bacterium]